MPRVAGVDIPANKPVYIALTHIFGIGQQTSKKLLEQAGINFMTRTKELNESDLAKLNNMIEDAVVVEGHLRRQISQNIQRLKEINCWRGMRHKKGLPVRGQRTQTNARTRKGPRKTVAGKKSVKETRG